MRDTSYRAQYLFKKNLFNLFLRSLHMYDISTLKEKKLPDLQEIAKKLGLKRTSALKKQELIYQIIDLFQPTLLKRKNR